MQEIYKKYGCWHGCGFLTLFTQKPSTRERFINVNKRNLYKAFVELLCKVLTMQKYLAGVLSAILPGLGQAYNRMAAKAIGLIVVYLATVWATFNYSAWIAIVPIIIWLYAIYEAYKTRAGM